jgi:hypothetical protein
MPSLKPTHTHLPPPPRSPPLPPPQPFPPPPTQGRGELSLYHDLPGFATTTLAADVQTSGAAAAGGWGGYTHWLLGGTSGAPQRISWSVILCVWCHPQTCSRCTDFTGSSSSSRESSVMQAHLLEHMPPHTSGDRRDCYSTYGSTGCGYNFDMPHVSTHASRTMHQ